MTAPTRSLVASARLALGFAIFLALAEIRRNWGDWGYWPFWVVDYIAVALLLVGWRKALSTPPSLRGPGILCGAWGFTCAMFYASFFSHMEHIGAPDHGPDDPIALTITIGVLFAITIIGFALALVGAGGGRAPSEKQT
jgi:hypothetical protein